MSLLKKVFADMGTETKSQYSQEQTFDKPKRSAFVFITTDSDNSDLALEDLKKIDEIREVYLSNGAYDLVAKVSGESFENLRETILKRIGNLSGVKSTLTLTII
jgi:DNA-binding Lrp family transcriptional regulator